MKTVRYSIKNKMSMNRKYQRVCGDRMIHMKAMKIMFFLIIRRQPISTRTGTLFPYSPLFRSRMKLAPRLPIGVAQMFNDHRVSGRARLRLFEQGHRVGGAAGEEIGPAERIGDRGILWLGPPRRLDPGERLVDILAPLDRRIASAIEHRHIIGAQGDCLLDQDGSE